MKQKVLIIGSKGMLGFDLMKVFKAEKSYSVKGVDVDSLDITKSKAVSSFVKEYAPDFVINAAAYTQVDACEDEGKKDCYAVNGDGPKFLAQACKEVGVVLVHVSTDYVFSGKNTKGYTERARMHPINHYGKSKAEGEKNIKEHASKFYIVRTSWLYGKNGDNFVKTMIELSKKHPELKVVNDQHGKPTYTKDLAAHILKLVSSGKPFGTYHFVNEGETTWYNFTREIMKQTKNDIKVNPCTSEEFPRPAPRPEYSTLLNTKFTRMRHWKRALGDYLKEIK